MRRRLLVVALVLTAAACTRVTYPPADRSGGGTSPTSPTPVTTSRVEFRVIGNATSARVRISTPLDGLTQVVTTLPYFASFRTTEDSVFVSLEVTPLSYSLLTTAPFLSAQIVVDGTLFREATSNELLLNTLSVNGTWRRP
jgi:hypothetical protein